MFRNSAWLLCLLCVGHALSQSPSHVSTPEQVLADRAKDGATNDLKLAEPQMKPAVAPTKPTEPPTKPTEPPTKPTEPPTKPTEPPTKPTEPPTKPTETPTKPTDPPTKPPTSKSTPPSPSTTTPIPVSPTPGPKTGSWSVKNDKNVTCLRIDGIFTISYSFNKTAVHFDVPVGAKVDGSCKAREGKIRLEWINLTHENSLEFIFVKNNESDKYVLAKFSGEIFVPARNETEHFNTNNNETHFETPVNQSYSCSSMKQIKVDNHTNIILDQFRLQAFKTSNGTGFDASVDCAGSAEHTPDIVPIIVGCVLALLVIAVLVAYLISRRRSQTRGYLSM